ncbi:MAG: ATP-dependent helicase C-terminal domain-containing protein, partial [bacterium]
GRAGRTQPGRCVRLWTESDHRGRPAAELPEAQCVDLSEAVLLLKANGIDDVAGFPWVDPPGDKSLVRAMELLVDLGAIDGEIQMLTPVGERLAGFPVHPRYGRMLLAADRYGCVSVASLVAALTSERGLLLRSQGSGVREKRDTTLGEEQESDILRLMKAWTYARDTRFDVSACQDVGIHARTARQVSRVHEQFMSIAREQGLDVADRDSSAPAIGKCILAGFPDHLGRRMNKGTLRYDLTHARRGVLDPESAVRDADMVVAAEIREIDNSRGDVEVRLSLVSRVESAWLSEVFPGATTHSREVFYDTLQKRVTAEDRESFRGLTLEATKAEPTDEEAALLLAREVAAGRLVLKNWNHEVEQWLLRVDRFAEWCPGQGIAPLTESDRLAVLKQICLGARSGKEIKERPVLPAVKGFLTRQQQAMLEKHVPERVTLSNGKSPKVTYDKANPPFVSMRIQELYGVAGAVTIAMGRVRVLVHILAPNQRPIQITNDLASFWNNGYPAAKKELQRRYPRHEWR